MALIDTSKNKASTTPNVYEKIFEVVEQFSEEENAAHLRKWRDKELKKTDWICAIPDHGMHDSYMTYRAALRNWPSTSDFPDTKPTL